MAKVRVSKHASIRFNERTDIERKDKATLSTLAMRNGIMWVHIQQMFPEFAKTYEGNCLRKYMSTFGGRRKKFYNGYIFIFGKNSKNLITMYPCKERYLKKLEKFYAFQKSFKNLSKIFQK